MGKYSEKRKQYRKLLLSVLLLFCLLPALFVWKNRAKPADSSVLLPDAPSHAAESSQKLIALTFDDGPHSTCTPRLLDGLAQRGVHATFFLIGSQVDSHAELVQQMDLAGHQIGLHTYDHVLLTALSPAEVSAQMERSRQVLSSLLGRDDFLVRPPYGITNAAVRACIASPLVLWSVDPKDWETQDTARIVRCVTSQAKDGDIILLHDIFPTSVDAALEIVDLLQAEDFRFVTVEQLFSLRGISMENGVCYASAPPS